MTDTLPAPPAGLAFYADSNDLANPERLMATLHRARAKVCLVPCESLPWPDGTIPRPSLPSLAALCDKMRGQGIDPIVYTFPAIDRDLVDSLAHYRAAIVACDALGQLDAEPHGGTHWTPSALAPWLDADPRMSITSTRFEAPHLGGHGRQLWMQLERRHSTDALASILAQWPDAVLVTGDFDRLGEPCTLADVSLDLSRCAAQARRVGLHGVWSAHTTSGDEADLFASWATGLGW